MIEYLDLLMFAAAILVLLLGFPVAFSLAGIAIIFALVGDYFGVFPIQFLKAIPQRIFGTMTNGVFCYTINYVDSPLSYFVFSCCVYNVSIVIYGNNALINNVNK